MKIKFCLLIILLLINLNKSFGQRKYLNKNYKLTEKSLTLSLVPIYNERPLLNDSILTKIFSNPLQNHKIIESSEVRGVIDSDKYLSELLTKIALKDYKRKELKTFPNLNTLLSQKEIEHLRKCFNNSDFILIPVAFNVKVVGKQVYGGHTFGYSKFRLYDLNSGEFIFECPNHLNVNIGSEKGAKNITTILIGMTFEFYRDKFLKENGIN